MRALSPAALAIFLCPSITSAQFMIRCGQERIVTGQADADDSVTFLSDTQTIDAQDYGAFQGSASALVDPSGATGNGSGYQGSTIASTTFTANGNCFTSVFDSSPWSATASGESRAMYDLRINVPGRYDVDGMIEGYDQGYAEWELKQSKGAYIDGRFGIENGPISIDATGRLAPGRYQIMFKASGGAFSSGDSGGYSSTAYDLVLEVSPLAWNYCDASPNSAGSGAEMKGAGTTSVSANDFHVEATGDVPGEFGLFYYGPNQVQMSFGDGQCCVGGGSWRVGLPLERVR
ncbi:MAG: hypothetical protein ACI841_002198 [Planctomycetota bacterium]|jgi:hypothetical protein